MMNRKELLSLVDKIYNESRYPTDEELSIMKLHSISRDNSSMEECCFALQHKGRLKGENPLYWILICWWAASENAIHLHYGCRIYNNVLSELFYDKVLEFIVCYVQDEKFRSYILKTLPDKLGGYSIHKTFKLESLETALEGIREDIKNNRPDYYLE